MPFEVNGLSTHPTGRSCEICQLVVGTYEPAVFIIGDAVIHSSRAAEPGLSRRPDLRSAHRDCYAKHGGRLHSA